MVQRSVMRIIEDYWSLTKWGLVFGNVITVFAGFALGAKVDGGTIDLPLFFITALGTCFVMASGCVLNNYVDRDIDALMERTQHRALVERRVSENGAIIFGVMLGLAGFGMLAWYTNGVTLAAAIIGFYFYTFMYTIWWKRRSVYGTVVGAVSGAMPPVIGYGAATGRFDAAAIILFLILMTWQIPHFFAIAIRREHEYAAAHIPVMPVVRGIRRTKVSMIVYIVESIVAMSLLTVFGYLGEIYLAIALLLGAVWLALAVKGLWISGAERNREWAYRMFFVSLVVMMALFITMSVAAVI